MRNASWIALGLTLAAGAALASVLSPQGKPKPTATRTASPGALEASFKILEPERADVRIDTQGQGRLDLLVENGGGKRELAFGLLLSKGAAKVEAPPEPLEEASVTLLKLKLTEVSGCPCRGALVVRSIAPAAMPLHLPLTLTPTPVTTGPAALAVWVSGLFAAVLGLACVVILWWTEKLTTSADAPQWKPEESWLTNLALLGAVFNGLFTVTALTEKLGSTGAGELLMTTAVFVALAGVAPAIFKMGSASATGGGSIRWFLAAAVFTAWAGAGQLALGGALLEDARAAGLLASLVCRLLQALIAVLVAFVGWYTLWSFAHLDTLKTEAGTEEAVGSRSAPGVTRWRLL
jgi:hypothetical protein